MLFCPTLIVSAAITGALYALHHAVTESADYPGHLRAPLPLIPTIKDWNTFSSSEITRHIRDKKLSMMITMDSTRRHHMLSQMTKNDAGSAIQDFQNTKHYASSGAHAAVKVHDLIFSHGIETLMSPALFPFNYLRSQDYLLKCLEGSQELLKEPFLSLYKKWNIKIRFYGDYAQGNCMKK